MILLLTSPSPHPLFAMGRDSSSGSLSDTAKSEQQEHVVLKKHNGGGDPFAPHESTFEGPCVSVSVCLCVCAREAVRMGE